MTVFFLYIIDNLKSCHKSCHKKQEVLILLGIWGVFVWVQVPSSALLEKGLKSRFSVENQWFQALFFCHEIVMNKCSLEVLKQNLVMNLVMKKSLHLVYQKLSVVISFYLLPVRVCRQFS